jgi:hypothetical protein
VNLREPAGFLGGTKERFGVDAMRDGYRCPFQ